MKDRRRERWMRLWRIPTGFRPQPRVARNELPWVIIAQKLTTATRLRPFPMPFRTNLFIRHSRCLNLNRIPRMNHTAMQHRRVRAYTRLVMLRRGFQNAGIPGQIALR